MKHHWIIRYVNNNLPGHIMVKRRKKKWLIKDIYVIGTGLVNRLEDKQLQKIMKSVKDINIMNDLVDSLNSEADPSVTRINDNMMVLATGLKSTILVLTKRLRP